MSGSSQSLNLNATDRRTPSTKRRRNVSGAWQYISQTTRKCLVESCTKTFSKNTATRNIEEVNDKL